MDAAKVKNNQVHPSSEEDMDDYEREMNRRHFESDDVSDADAVLAQR